MIRDSVLPFTALNNKHSNRFELSFGFAGMFYEYTSKAPLKLL